MVSIAASVVLTLTGPSYVRSAAPESPPMFVLQVGISDYVYAKKLRGPVNDVTEMRKLLEGERFKVPAGNIVTLTNAEGTKQNIFDKYRDHLVANVRKYYEATKKRDAVAMFQFSGHGSQVPDLDGDERYDDDLDETLVTYDSQDVEGRNFDITDDEIYLLTGELKQYTDNIVYIFDNCHSGSGTRDPIEEGIRKLAARKTQPVRVERFGTVKTPAQNGSGGFLPPGEEYIVITAASAGELAKETCIDRCGVEGVTPVVLGNLTHSLLEEFANARSDTSYREVMQNVRRSVANRNPNQTPQLEGDWKRFVFGGLSSREDNFVHIAEAGEPTEAKTQSIKLNAGALQGLEEGTIISVYDKSVARFNGARKIASGTVIQVGSTESIASVSISTRPISADDKVAALSTDIKSARLRANVRFDEKKFSARERSEVAEIETSFAPKPNTRSEVELVTGISKAGEAGWQVAMLKDKYRSVASKIPGSAHANFACENLSADPDNREKSIAAAKLLSPERDVFYFAGPDFVPLYGLCIEADATAPWPSTANRKIEDILAQIARLRAVAKIFNPASSLAGKVIVKPMKLVGKAECVAGEFKPENAVPFETVPNSTDFRIAVEDIFWFEVTNNSDTDLYLALLNMTPNGGVNVFAPGRTDPEKDGILIPKNGGRKILRNWCRAGSNGSINEAGVMIADYPLGMDRFKIIAATSKIRFDQLEFLEMDALAARSSALSLTSQSDWVVIDTAFLVSDKDSKK